MIWDSFLLANFLLRRRLLRKKSTINQCLSTKINSHSINGETGWRDNFIIGRVFVVWSLIVLVCWICDLLKKKKMKKRFPILKRWKHFPVYWTRSPLTCIFRHTKHQKIWNISFIHLEVGRKIYWVHT